jgi:hypothetical protein
MIPFGAPYEDINLNGAFDELIDRPGMPEAIQTIFICLTDADASNHTSSEGFSGGTWPLYAEVHLTAWAYDFDFIDDVQFFQWSIVNKSNAAWNKTYFSIVTDPDLGDAEDDYIGCDTSLQLAYCYNSDNVDGSGSGRSYGTNPPAVGQSFFRSAISRNNGSIDTLKMTSTCYFTGTGSPGPTCEQDPSSAPLLAYHYMEGLKKDGSQWLNPLTIPYSATKFCYSGNPEDSTGWVEKKGRVESCGGFIPDSIRSPSPAGDRRFILSSGSQNFTVNAGDTQKIVMGQMIARGNNNVNGVTKLKELARITRRIYYEAIEGTESYFIGSPVPLPIHTSFIKTIPIPLILSQRLSMK